MAKKKEKPKEVEKKDEPVVQPAPPTDEQLDYCTREERGLLKDGE